MKKKTSTKLSLRSVHPFPARMAPEIAFKVMPAKGKLTVLDPMVGSGTTLAVARMKGHSGIGFDLDPLAILISRGWSTAFAKDGFVNAAQKAVASARRRAPRIQTRNAFPRGADLETRKFVRYWFDVESRKELLALVRAISQSSPRYKTLMWCAFSRTIITKASGVSLAMDVSHSRPHRVYDKAPVRPINAFAKAVEFIAKAAPFADTKLKIGPRPKIRRGDARHLPLADSSVDIIITSPPYLNAIDYLRGHKLTLVWRGVAISTVRGIRSKSIGAEVKLKGKPSEAVKKATARVYASTLTDRQKAIFGRYAEDVSCVMRELFRVLKPTGKLVLVIGDCKIRGASVNNSQLFKAFGADSGFRLSNSSRRALKKGRRYLPPPTAKSSGKSLSRRMTHEVILTFHK